MMKKSASIVGLCLILVIAGCAGSDVAIPGADRVVSDLISEEPGAVTERAAVVAQKAKEAKCDARSASVRNKIEGKTWTVVEEVQGGGSEHVEKCVAGLCKKGIKVDLDDPTVEGSYAFFLKFDPTSMEPWSKLHERDGGLKKYSITLTQLENSFKKGFSSQEDEMWATIWYGYGSLEDIVKQHHNSPYGKLKNRMNGEYAPALCMYGDCHQVPRHSSYAGNMFAIGYEYPELFEKYPELWPADLKVDPLDCYQPPDVDFFTPEGEYASCSDREEVVREKFGGKTMEHPVLGKLICTFGFCEEGINISIAHYSGVSGPIDAPPPAGNVVVVDGTEYVLWGYIPEMGAGNYIRHDTYEDNMFALGYLYPNLFDRHPEWWPYDLTEDPLDCYAPPSSIWD